MEAMPEGAILLGEKGYDSNAIRETAAKRNCWANSPTAPIQEQADAWPAPRQAARCQRSL
jgi:hypothetical protein